MLLHAFHFILLTLQKRNCTRNRQTHFLRPTPRRRTSMTEAAEAADAPAVHHLNYARDAARRREQPATTNLRAWMPLARTELSRNT